MKKKRCEFCGKEFIPNTEWQKFCSYECHKEYRRAIQNKETFRLTKRHLLIRNKYRGDNN